MLDAGIEASACARKSTTSTSTSNSYTIHVEFVDGGSDGQATSKLSRRPDPRHNYHIKTLISWACKLKPRSWWNDDLNTVRLGVELLHTLGVWLTNARCQHYFIHNCKLFDQPDNWYCSPLLIASRLMSETEVSLAEWFINSYIRKCA